MAGSAIVELLFAAFLLVLFLLLLDLLPELLALLGVTLEPAGESTEGLATSAFFVVTRFVVARFVVARFVAAFFVDETARLAANFIRTDAAFFATELRAAATF